MLEAPPQGSPLTAPVPRLSGVRALRAAERELLASQQAARRAPDVINAYEARHGEEPLTGNRATHPAGPVVVDQAH